MMYQAKVRRISLIQNGITSSSSRKAVFRAGDLRQVERDRIADDEAERRRERSRQMVRRKT